MTYTQMIKAFKCPIWFKTAGTEKWRTVDPWTTQVWTAQVHLYTDFFQKICEYLYWFWSTVGSLQVQRVTCVHWSTLFYVEDFSTLAFRYLQGVLDPIHYGYWETTKFWGNQKLCMNFQMWEVGRNRVSLLTPALFKHQL